MSNNNPSIDPANNGSLAGTIQFAFSKMMQQVNGMLPASVLSYDRATNRAQVQLLIDIVGTDGTQYPRPQLASVPVFVFGGGGFRLSFPLEKGNMGWVIANDRDISLFLQSMAQSAPNTARVKSFSDGVFFPDAMSLDNLAGSDLNNAVLQNAAGTVTISIKSDTVTITSPNINFDTGDPTSLIWVNGTLNVSGTVAQGVPYAPPT